MYYPSSFWLASLDVKSQEVKAVIDMGDKGLFFGQLQVQFVFQEVSDFLLGLFHAFYPVIAEDDKVISISD